MCWEASKGHNQTAVNSYQGDIIKKKNCLITCYEWYKCFISSSNERVKGTVKTFLTRKSCYYHFKNHNYILKILHWNSFFLKVYSFLLLTTISVSTKLIIIFSTQTIDWSRTRCSLKSTLWYIAAVYYSSLEMGTCLEITRAIQYRVEKIFYFKAKCYSDKDR